MKTKSRNTLLKKGEDGFYLEGQPEFVFPLVLYGKLDEVAERVLQTFKGKEGNTGALFSGIKGNSKSTTAKYICHQSNLPVVMISEPFTGADFKDFLGKLSNTIIFLDEFEKVYPTEELQQEFLSILDGVFTTKNLYLFTSNSAEINPYLRNRPSRIYYHFKYDNLDKEDINTIIEDRLVDKSFEADLRAVLLVLGAVSYDVILNLISEVNRFKRSPKELIKGMNIEVEQTHFNVVGIIRGERMETSCRFNPLTVQDFFLDFKDDKGRFKWVSGTFLDYTMYTQGGSFIFENKENKLIFTPFKPFKFEL